MIPIGEVFQAPLPHQKNPRSSCCSLQRVIRVIQRVATILLLGFLLPMQAIQNPQVLPISREQIPPSCIPPQELRPYLGSTRVGDSLNQSFPYRAHWNRPQMVEFDGISYLLSADPADLEKHNERAHLISHLKSDPTPVKITIGNSTYFLWDNDSFKILNKDKTLNFIPEKGVEIHYRNGLTGIETQVYLFHSKIQNHRDVEDFLSQWVKNVDQYSTDKICDLYLQTHSRLGRGYEENLGTYRQTGVIVPICSYQNGFMECVEKYGQPQDISRAKKIEKKLKKDGTIKKIIAIIEHKLSNKEIITLNQLTQEEKALFKKWIFIPPTPSKIRSLMREDFAKTLKVMIHHLKNCPNADPIAIGALIFRKLQDIHPTSNLNGRMGRELMNEIFMIGGYPPVVFPNLQEYGDAIAIDKEQPGYFATYLREKILPWTEKWFGPHSKCLRGILT